MRLTEGQIRGIIREELIREGFFGDMFGKVRGVFGGGEAAAPAGLEAAIRPTRAMVAFGITPEMVANFVSGKGGPDLRTRTSPAHFTFTRSGDPDYYRFNHPYGNPEEAAELGLGEHIGDSMLVSIPEQSRMLFKYPPGLAREEKKAPLLGAVKAVVGPTPSDRELDYVSRMGGDPDGWQQATRDMGVESRLDMLTRLRNALTVSRLISRAYDMSLSCWGEELTARLFRAK